MVVTATREVGIDPEFQALIPPLSGEEARQLEENLKADGCRHALDVWKGVIVDGHNRFEICNRLGIPFETQPIKFLCRDDAKKWIIRNQFGRRNLTAYQRGELALLLKPLIQAKAKENKVENGRVIGRGKELQNSVTPIEKVNTQKELAKEAQISHDTLHKVEVLSEKAPEEVKEKLRKGETTINREYKALKKNEDRKAKEEATAKAKETISKEVKEKIESVCDLRVCSVAELFASGIRPDAVITDPPYNKEAVRLFSDLAAGCKACEIPLVAVMSGQSYFPEVMAALTEHLTYRWLLAYLTPGGQAVQQWTAKVNTFWKPVLLFGEAVEWFGDVYSSKTNDNDKNHHKWGQSESGMADLVERLTKPGQTVCDPFLGGGTTAVVSLRLGRKFIGCDVDPTCIDKTRSRVEALEW